ncbi:MAG: DUF6992 family protein [Chitinophagaceae bacterium]
MYKLYLAIIFSSIAIITKAQNITTDSSTLMIDSIKKENAFVSLDSIAKRRNQLNKTNMSILAGWAAVNIVQSAISAGNATGVDKGFFQMNVYWNTVNLAIAGVGLLGVKKAMNKKQNLFNEINVQDKLERILLINSALDVGYIFGGLYLQERGKRLVNKQTEGFGKSIVIQGTFLLGFDIVQYYLHRKNGKHLQQHVQKLQFNVNENGIGLRIKL